MGLDDRDMCFYIFDEDKIKNTDFKVFANPEAAVRAALRVCSTEENYFIGDGNGNMFYLVYGGTCWKATN